MTLLWKLPIAALFLFVAVRLSTYALGEEVAPSIIDAFVTKVQDGDSFKATAVIWIDQRIDIDVRLRGIDAPEKNGKCPAERWAALQATTHLKEAIEGRDVILTEIGEDKYGRVLSRVWLGERDIADEMLSAGLVREYSGEARKGWC